MLISKCAVVGAVDTGLEKTSIVANIAVIIGKIRLVFGLCLMVTFVARLPLVSIGASLVIARSMIPSGVLSVATLVLPSAPG